MIPKLADYQKLVIRPVVATRAAAATSSHPEQEEIDRNAVPRNMGEMTSASRAAFQGDLTFY